MKIKPVKDRGKVLVEVGPRDSALLGEESLLQMKSVLVPIDFSDTSLKGLQYAIAFARQFHAKVLILHVTEIPMGTAEGGIAISEGLIQEMQREAQERLSGLMVQARQRNVSARTLTRTGIPYHEIVEAAKEEQADLVIISTRGRTGLRRLVLGSTAERVARYAPCPVLVVREKERELISEGPLEQVRSVPRSKRRWRGHMLPPIPPS